MQLPIIDDVFTGDLTNSTLIITSSMGIKQISVFNGGATVGTVTGGKNLGSLSSSALTVAEGSSVNITSTEGANILDGITIVAPVGCTLSIIAVG